MLKPRAIGQIQTPGTALCPQFIILPSNFRLLLPLSLPVPISLTPPLPGPGPAHDATREKQIPFIRVHLAEQLNRRLPLPV